MFKREILIGKDSETNEDIILNYSNSYAISSNENITPLFFNNVNHWLAAITLFPDYIIELPIEDNNSQFNEEEYNKFIKEFIKSADYIILEYQLGLALVGNLSELILPIIHANMDIVTQYKNGNIKIINSLIGKVLKSQKGLDPNSIKEELLKIVETI